MKTKVSSVYISKAFEMADETNPSPEMFMALMKRNIYFITRHIC
jgi:hypothetical protein